MDFINKIQLHPKQHPQNFVPGKSHHQSSPSRSAMEEVSKWHGVEADWTDLVHYPSLLLLMMLKSSVGSLLQSETFDDLVKPARQREIDRRDHRVVPGGGASDA